jgi:UDP-N-acetylmuramoyl-tripeptide--D-alanyl-D-alanine ligase
LNADHKIAVVELGMNHPGEISYLANIAKPTVALVNNAQREHLEFMVSVEAVAHENGSVISSLPDAGVAVYPADDDYSATWKALAKQRKTITFAMDSDADVRSFKVDWINAQWQVDAKTPMGDIRYCLNIAGRHNVKNSLAAAACALAAGIPINAITAGLQAFAPVKGRSLTSTILVNGCEVLLIDDTYNANPDSMKVAIDALADMAAPRLIVMGDMGEVGEQGLAFHAEAGEYAQKKGIQYLFAFGDLSREAAKHFKGAQYFETLEALTTAVSHQLGDVKSILVKGSRFMKMERVCQHIMALDTQSKNNNKNKETAHVA